MIKCDNCNDRKFIPQGKKMVPCPYCVTEERLIASLKKAIEDSYKGGRKEFSEKLEKVLAFLPEYPIMAILEAEELGLHENLILMIRDSFDIRPFMDVEYKKG